MRILTLMLLLLVSGLEAQQLKWEPGFFLGGANYQGDLVETYGPFLPETNLAYGGSLRYNLGREWAFNLGLISGHISGSDQNLSDPRFVASRNINFRSRLTETALRIEWEPFGNRRYPKEGGYKKLFSPFFFTGIAYSFLKNGTDYSNVPRTLILEQVALDKMAIEENTHLAIPVGGGIKIDLSKYTALYVQAGLRKAFTDLLDGVSASGNPDTDDWYSFGGITLSRRFGLPDYDRDGIVDRDDRCPRQAGVASAQGCPDADGDGVEDLEDVCPLAFGDIELNGCPDTDGDKVIDLLDDCPYAAGLEAFNGCPDTDEDGIIDSEDACPNVAGVAEENGCPYPDTDADGIIDKEDQCPDTPGVPEENGCPYPDSDADGIIDREDACPDLPGTAELGGCPDTDADGIIDPDDRCPNTPGLSEREGCPEIEEEDKALLKLAMETVRFETASATLKPASLTILDQVADVLVKYPDYGLRVSGHTDNQGDDENNLVLSERRAQSCLQYLAGTGIDHDRMLHEGLGETRPIGDNTTAEGRRINRRVEFELFIQERQVEQVEEIPMEEVVVASEADTKADPAPSTPSANADPITAGDLDLLPQSAETVAQEDTNPADNQSGLPTAPDTLSTATPEAIAQQTETPMVPPMNADEEKTNRPSSEPITVDSLNATSPETIARQDPKLTEPQTRPLLLPNEEQPTTADSLNTAAPEAIADTRPEAGASISATPNNTDTTLSVATKLPVDTDTVLIADPPQTIAENIPEDSIIPEIAANSPPPATKPLANASETLSSASTMRALQPRTFETPDTIYWFEPDNDLAGSRSANDVVDIELPGVYLRPEPAADTISGTAPPDAALTPKEPPLPVEKEAEKFVPKSSMEQKVEALERRIEALEEQIRRLEKLLIKQSSAPTDSLRTNPPPVKQQKEGNG